MRRRAAPEWAKRVRLGRFKTGNVKVHTMKIAISVDDQLIIAVDRAAREIGVSRSRLFSLALEGYLRNLKHQRIVEQLNQVYGSESDAAETLTAARLKTKFRSTIAGEGSASPTEDSFRERS